MLPILMPALGILLCVVLLMVIPAGSIGLWLILGAAALTSLGQLVGQFAAYKACNALVETHEASPCGIRFESGTKGQIYAAVGDEFGHQPRASYIVLGSCKRFVAGLVGGVHEFSTYRFRDGTHAAVAMRGEHAIVLLPRREYDEPEKDDAASINADWHVMRAGLLKGTSPEKAMNAYEAALAETPDDTSIILRKAQLHLEQEQYAQADSTACGAIAQGIPDSERAVMLWVRAQASAAMGKVDEALDFVDTALFLHPDYLELREFRCYLLIEADRCEDASEEIVRLCETGGASDHCIGSITYALMSYAMPPDAVPILDRVLESPAQMSAPTRALLLSMRSLCNECVGDMAAALADLDAAIQLDPTSAEAYRARAELHLKQDPHSPNAARDYYAAQTLVHRETKRHNNSNRISMVASSVANPFRITIATMMEILALEPGASARRADHFLATGGAVLVSSAIAVCEAHFLGHTSLPTAYVLTAVYFVSIVIATTISHFIFRAFRGRGWSLIANINATLVAMSISVLITAWVPSVGFLIAYFCGLAICLGTHYRGYGVKPGQGLVAMLSPIVVFVVGIVAIFVIAFMTFKPNH